MIPQQQLEELRAINGRLPLQSFGIWMLGPALLHFGTHEQKLHYLPPIARGEIRRDLESDLAVMRGLASSVSLRQAVFEILSYAEGNKSLMDIRTEELV